MSRELTEKQSLFLEYLFNEAKGDAVKAKIMAGFAPETPTSQITKALENEIVERTRKLLLVNGPKAVIALMEVLEDPTELGVQHKITVAKDLLDRIGVVKTEKIEVMPGAFILPPKNKKD